MVVNHCTVGSDLKLETVKQSKLTSKRSGLDNMTPAPRSEASIDKHGMVIRSNLSHTVPHFNPGVNKVTSASQTMRCVARNQNGCPQPLCVGLTTKEKYGWNGTLKGSPLLWNSALTEQKNPMDMNLMLFSLTKVSKSCYIFLHLFLWQVFSPVISLQLLAPLPPHGVLCNIWHFDLFTSSVSCLSFNLSSARVSCLMQFNLRILPLRSFVCVLSYWSRYDSLVMH